MVALEKDTIDRFVRPLWGIPGTRIGIAADRSSIRWEYWWQAHLLDCLIDAQLRDPQERRIILMRQLIRGIHARNLGRWLNYFYDDIAWLGLALQRASAFVATENPIKLIEARLRDGWRGGGIFWHRPEPFTRQFDANHDYKNAPTNGAAAIFFARLGDVEFARCIVDWLDDTLLDAETGLLFDGVHVRQDGTIREYETTIYSYNQGVYLGACVELGLTGRAERTIAAITDRYPGEVPAGTRNEGLFFGIMVRYLALAAQRMGSTAARNLVLSADQSAPAAEELSLQLSRWMTREAATRLR
jgi:predicted alpha-1,6-mannanase (GH76 family)